MPGIGERKTKNGVTGEWNGETWVRVPSEAPATATAAPAATDVPKVGDRKTRDGVTGEWDGTTWRKVGTSERDIPAEESRTPPTSTPTSVGDVGTGLSVAGAAFNAAKPALRVAGRAASSPAAQRAIANTVTAGVGAAVGGWPGALIGREAAPLVKPVVSAIASRAASLAPSVALRVGSVPISLLQAMLAQPGGNPGTVSADERAQRQQSAEIEYRRISGKDPRTGLPIRRQDINLPVER